MTASLVNHRQPQRNEAASRHAPGNSGNGGHGAAVVPDQGPHLTPARPLRLVPRPEGLLQIHTAPFRGSFSAVFSQALRTAGLGSRVLISQFLKGGVDQGLEGSLWLCGRLQWLRPDTHCCLESPAAAWDAGASAGAVESDASTDPDQERPDSGDPRAAVQQVWAYSRQQLLEGSVDLMVLDELGLAVELGYLPAAEVTATLERRPAHLDVILTGPSMPAALMAMADQVTQLRRGTH